MRDSAGEIKIFNILSDNDIPFAEEYEFDDLVADSSGRHLRFDFCVFTEDGDIDFLIEFQGRQHYKAIPKFGGRTGFIRQKHNDIAKRKYCDAHNIKLVIIPY
jgi:hypothetical protein